MTRQRLWIIGILAAASLGLSGPAHAAGSKEAQAQKALKQALEEDYLETRFDDAEQKLRAALQSCGKSCSPQLRAKLHAALGAVLAGGKKELEDARDAFVEALSLDPKIEPNPDVLSTEVTFAYEQARKKLKLSPGAPADTKAKKPTKAEREKADKEKADKERADKEKADKEKADGDDKEDKGDKPPPEAPKEPAKPAEPARKNWVTITFAPDISLVSGSNVCTQDVQSAKHYVCVRQDAANTRYVGTPTQDNADNINTGLALSTLRIMLGYDRLLIDNLSLGVRVGFAFNGASGGNASFLPVHAEGRLGIWPGHQPFVGSGVRPFIMVSGGIAQIDTKVNVNVLEDSTACGPVDAMKQCTNPSKDGVFEKREQTLTVYRQAGLGFTSVAFGVQFAPSAKVGINLGVRASVTFPVLSAVFSPEGGLSLGF